MKHLTILILLTFIAIQSYGQEVRLISDKKSEFKVKGGIVFSKDSYSLLIQKSLVPKDSLNYFLRLNADPKVLLSDSLLNSKGNFELFLTNGKIIVIENAECHNDPLGDGNSVGFTVKTTELIIEQLVNNPIQKLKVFGILETEFSPRKLKQQQELFTSLKNEN